MSTDPNDITNLPLAPISNPVNSADIIPFGRVPADPTQDTIPFQSSFGRLDPAIRPKGFVSAGGSTAEDASALTMPVMIIVTAAAGGGVFLRGIPNETQVILNGTGTPVVVYGPQPIGYPAGTINGGPAVSLQGGSEVSFHTKDGVAYFAAGGQ